MDVIDELLQKEAQRHFPHWSQGMRDRWVAAKRKARRCTPHFALLLPMTNEQIRHERPVFAPRTLREACQ